MLLVPEDVRDLDSGSLRMATHSKPTNGGRKGGEDSTDWSDPGELKHLHVERGWTARDISREFDVEPATVRDRLKELDLWQGDTRVPKFGLARKVWEHDLEDGGIE